MELTDERWIELRQVTEAKAMQFTYGDRPMSEDLASMMIMRLITHGGSVEVEKLPALVRAMTRNAYLDRRRKQYAAHRGGPSRKVLRREWDGERVDAYLEILDSLPDKKQRMVRMAAEGATHQQIADELGMDRVGHLVYRDVDTASPVQLNGCAPYCWRWVMRRASSAPS